MDWRQLWEIISAPDNVPIVGLIPLLAFYIYLAWKQAHANDQLIVQLEGDAALADLAEDGQRAEHVDMCKALRRRRATSCVSVSTGRALPEGR